MSTKTTFKRVALVAVAALGFGMLSAVPSSAATSTTTVDAITVTTPTSTVLLSGGAVSSTFSLSTTAALANTETANVRVTLSTPSASALTDSSAFVTNAGKAAELTSGTAGAGTGGDKVMTYKVVSAGAITAATSTVAGTLTITPDVPGTYTLTVAATTAADDDVLVTAGASATMTIVVRSLAYATGDSAAAAPYEVGTGVVGVANTVTVTALTLGAANRRALVSVSGADATISTTTGDTATVAADFKSALITASSSAATPRTTNIFIKTPTAGTITVSLFNETAANSGLFSATAANTVTITVNATALNGVFASSLVSAVSGQTATAGDLTGETTDTYDSTPQVYTATASTVAKATYKVEQFDTTGAAIAQAERKSVSVETTLGAVGTSANTPAGAYAAVAGSTAAGNPQFLYLFSDGRSGKGVVTIKVNGVTVKTFNVTFVSTTIAKLTIAPFRPVIATNIGSTTGGAATATDNTSNYVKSAWQFILNALDSNDNPNQSTTAPAVTITSSDPSCATAALGSAYSSVYGGWAVTGTAVGTACSTTITVKNTATGLISVTGVIRVGSTTISDLVMTLDKAEYEPGEKVTLTLTAKSADGQAPADGTYPNLLTTAVNSTQVLTSYPFSGYSPALASAAAGYPDAGDVTFTGGKATATFYAPANNFTVSATTNALSSRLTYNMQGLALSAKGTIKATATEQAAIDSATAAQDAAAEATDAANAATDAANAAAEAADAATAAAQDAADAVAALATSVSEMVNALKKQITSLTNLVIKIQKKVKA
jgi:hypothetical protein